MVGSDVALQVAGICKDFVAVFAGKSAEFAVDHFMSKQIGAPCETFGAMFTRILTAVVTVSFNHVLIEPVKSKDDKNGQMTKK